MVRLTLGSCLQEIIIKKFIPKSHHIFFNFHPKTSEKSGIKPMRGLGDLSLLMKKTAHFTSSSEGVSMSATLSTSEMALGR